MLTIDEIKNVSFRKATRGYNADEVDSFIDEVIASFEQLKKEKTNLVHKIDRLATRLEEYRADEETVRNALLTSQKMSDACIREAKEKAARTPSRRRSRSQPRQTVRPLPKSRITLGFRLTRSLCAQSSLSFTASTSSLSTTFPPNPTLKILQASSTKSIPPRQATPPLLPRRPSERESRKRITAMKSRKSPSKKPLPTTSELR